jgi:hypothetical protein
MRGNLSVIWCVGLLFCLCFKLTAQTTQSPYTALGIGDILQPSLVNHMGMGVASVAYPSNKNFNLLNPAMLGMRGYFTSFEVGFSGERRMIASDTLKQTNGSGNINYLALAFPIKQSRISAGFGLAPYSFIDYNIISKNEINGIEEEADVNFKGSGGLNTVFFSTGFNLFQTLALGVKVSYLFGSKTEETIFDIDQDDSFSSALYETTKVNDILLGFGATYFIKLSEKSQLFLAGIYDLGTDLNATRDERLEQRQKGTGLLLSTDTIVSALKETIRLPQKYGFGISYTNGTRWLISSDVVIQDWNEFSDPASELKFPLVKSYRIGLGVEFVPDAASVSNYFKRMIYRAGMSYESTPYNVNNEQIYDFGINFGVSLPVINRSSPSLVSVAFQYGQRSGGGDFAITENYFRLALGFTINDIWFYRRKIE